MPFLTFDYRYAINHSIVLPSLPSFLIPKATETDFKQQAGLFAVFCLRLGYVDSRATLTPTTLRFTPSPSIHSPLPPHSPLVCHRV